LQFLAGADWLQGPYVYALYAHYGYDIQWIGILFIVGFGTAAFVGTFVGSAADRYGRKTICVFFGIIYGISCTVKHWGDFHMLMIGRILAGIGTSILFSAFESWMVSQHHSAGYKEEWLSVTFSLATSGNGIVAILAGIMAGAVRDKWGPVAPFDLSLVLLVIGTTVIIFTWEENYGDRNTNVGTTVWNAFGRLVNDRKILLLGIVQSCFEGSMYIFVFMWTPSLESTSHMPILHGWIFASFMICVLIGSTVFGYLMRTGQRVERFTGYMLAVACVALFIPAFTKNHNLRLLSFFLFECCCGVYWPALGTMRSRYIPEEVRATVMNVFRVPLNCLVVCVLNEISRMHETSAFALVTVFLLIGALTQFGLSQSMSAGAIHNPDQLVLNGPINDYSVSCLCYVLQ
jgi:MFS family permease